MLAVYATPPTYMFNKHPKLKVEPLITPQPTNDLSLKCFILFFFLTKRSSPFAWLFKQRFWELSSLLCFLFPLASLSPSQLLSWLLKYIPKSLTSPHHCCYHPIQITVFSALWHCLLIHFLTLLGSLFYQAVSHLLLHHHVTKMTGRGLITSVAWTPSSAVVHVLCHLAVSQLGTQ